jgi:hypothetical protein
MSTWPAAAHQAIRAEIGDRAAASKVDIASDVDVARRSDDRLARGNRGLAMAGGRRAVSL